MFNGSSMAFIFACDLHTSHTSSKSCAELQAYGMLLTHLASGLKVG